MARGSCVVSLILICATFFHLPIPPHTELLSRSLHRLVQDPSPLHLLPSGKTSLLPLFLSSFYLFSDLSCSHIFPPVPVPLGAIVAALSAKYIGVALVCKML